MERILFRSYQTIFRGGIIFLLWVLTACNPNDIKPKQTAPRTIKKEFNIYRGTKVRALDTYYTSLFKRGIFNGNVLVGQKGKIIFQKSYGYSNLRSRKPLQLNSVFQLGSVSKQFTAVAILQLYEQGKLSLKDSVQRFFPDFPYKNINLHQLLCHRSGLMNYIYYCDAVWINKEVPLQNQSVIQLLTDSFPNPYYPPNRRFDYSNTGYMLLAAIVEKVSGLPFRTYMKERIFEPLGMKDSYIYNHQYPYKSPHLADGYEYGRIVALPDFLDGTVGDKGVYSTIRDLWLWDQGLYSNKIIQKETLDIAFQPYGKSKRATINYGYGWRMYNTQDSTKVLYHAGWWHGYNTLLMRIEKDSSTVVVLKNRSNGARTQQEYILEVLNLNEASEK